MTGNLLIFNNLRSQLCLSMGVGQSFISSMLFAGTSLLFGCARWCRPSETDKDCECKQARAKRVVKHPCYVPIRNEVGHAVLPRRSVVPQRGSVADLLPDVPLKDHDDLALIETDVDLYGECESGVAVHGLNGTFDLPVGSLVRSLVPDTATGGRNRRRHRAPQPLSACGRAGRHPHWRRAAAAGKREWIRHGVELTAGARGDAPACDTPNGVR